MTALWVLRSFYQESLNLLASVFNFDHFAKRAFAQCSPDLVYQFERGKDMSFYVPSVVPRVDGLAKASYISLEERRQPGRSSVLLRHLVREHGPNRSSPASNIQNTFT